MCIRSATVRVLIPSLAREKGVVRSVTGDAEILNLLLELRLRRQLHRVVNISIYQCLTSRYFKHQLVSLAAIQIRTLLSHALLWEDASINQGIVMNSNSSNRISADLINPEHPRAL